MYELITLEELRPNHERNAPHSFVTLVWILSVALKKTSKTKGKETRLMAQCHLPRSWALTLDYNAVL